MVVVTPGPADLNLKTVACWHASDPLLNNSPVVIFIGPSTTTNATQNSSRIQAHVFSIAGLLSFSRITISPTSTLYEAVDKLPRDAQGNEIRRQLAVGLYNYFNHMSKHVKESILGKWSGTSGGNLLPRIFDDAHAASLAMKMTKAPNAEQVAACITMAMAERSVSWLDVDVILPTDSITVLQPAIPEGRASLVPLPDTRPTIDYGKYGELLDLLGESTFLPTSRLRRAPSKPTAVSRTRTLDKAKEQDLKREMRELVSTENSYVAKLRELVNTIAPQIQSCATSRVAQTIFPASLHAILQLNEDFLGRISVIAEQDKTDRDPTGALGFSKTMRDFFPKFKEPYQDYLRVSSQFSEVANELLKDRDSHVARAIQSIGEQRLRSWLIEPVQRLPRYSLFIDNMANLLPATHPAMSRFLSARDMITDICALEDESTEDNGRTIERLRNIVSGWSGDFEPTGRLVAAVDCNELETPYAPDPYGRTGIPNVLLLFPDALVAVDKVGSVSARGVLAEVDRGPTAPSLLDALKAGATPPFTFRLAMSLKNIRLTESHAGKVLNVTYSRALREATGYMREHKHATHVYQLLGAYEGKAGKFSEEHAMARIEHRYPQELREDDKWALKSTAPQSAELGLVCAVSSISALVKMTTPKQPVGRTRVVMGNCFEKLTPKLANSLMNGVEILANVNPLEDEKFSIQVLSRGKQASVDTVAPEDFLTCLTKRLGYVLSLHHRLGDSTSAQQYIVHATNIASALEPLLNPSDPFASNHVSADTEKRRNRPLSPVKNLTNLFGGGVTSHTGSFRGQRGRTNTAKSAAAPPVLAPAQHGARPMSYAEPSKGQGTLEAYQRPAAKDPDKQVEETFNSYIVAIRARRGNIVGRTLQNRKAADEAAVNELYNILIQDPSNLHSTADLSSDVIFASFEKFLATAWKARFGPILPSEMSTSMQDVLFSNQPGFVAKFKLIMNRMSDVNRQAFKTLVEVLAELVGATGNAGDRGVLVATFTEAVIMEDKVQDHMHLFDRLLADSDILLNIEPPDPTPEQPENRDRAKGTGSIGSTASSIGKKLGWLGTLGGLTRGNSKNEGESRFGMFTRQLSKRSNHESEGTPPSLGRSFLTRNRSVDTRSTTPRSPTQSRPGSSYSGQERDNSRPGSAHGLLNPLSRIAEHSNAAAYPPNVVDPAVSGRRRKKRRSSLSDLPNARIGHDNRIFDHQASPAPVDPIASPILALQAPNRPGLQRSPTTNTLLARGRPAVSPLKENAPPVLGERNMNQPYQAARPSGPRSRTTQSPAPNSGIPLAVGRHERKESRQLPLLPVPQLSPVKLHQQQFPTPEPQTSPRRLRVQSPNKLQERVNIERQSMQSAGVDLQTELDQIGRELEATTGLSTAPRALAARVANMESMLRDRLDALGAHTDAISADLASSLQVSELKVKELDRLYRVVSIESEAMYETFNVRLRETALNIRGAPSVDGRLAEMSRLMDIKEQELATLRKKVLRLERENLGLKVQLDGNGSKPDAERDS